MRNSARFARTSRARRSAELTDLLVRYLDVMHAVSSPMNVVTLGLDMARMRLEADDAKGLLEALSTIEEGCGRVVELRRTVAAETPEWAHALRRARVAGKG